MAAQATLDWAYALFLAAVQALTEFLPISSSGHLVLASAFAGVEYQGLLFDLVLHLGTLTAVALYFRAELLSLAQALLRWRGGLLDPEQRLAAALLLTAVPPVVVALLVPEQVWLALRDPVMVATMLIVFGLLLGLVDSLARPRVGDPGLPLWAGLVCGCAQSVALIPGVSRSGSLMIALRALGYERTTAARYAFLSSVPVLSLGVVKVVMDLGEAQAPVALLPLALGFVGSALFGLVVIAWFLELLRRFGIWPYVIYRVVLGSAVLIWAGL